ncbi:uncharacterized protein AAGF69_003406 [Amazona ochrocephala]
MRRPRRQARKEGGRPCPASCATAVPPNAAVVKVKIPRPQRNALCCRKASPRSTQYSAAIELRYVRAREGAAGESAPKDAFRPWRTRVFASFSVRWTPAGRLDAMELHPWGCSKGPGERRGEAPSSWKAPKEGMPSVWSHLYPQTHHPGHAAGLPFAILAHLEAFVKLTTSSQTPFLHQLSFLRLSASLASVFGFEKPV